MLGRAKVGKYSRLRFGSTDEWGLGSGDNNM